MKASQIGGGAASARKAFWSSLEFCLSFAHFLKLSSPETMILDMVNRSFSFSHCWSLLRTCPPPASPPLYTWSLVDDN